MRAAPVLLIALALAAPAAAPAAVPQAQPAAPPPGGAAAKPAEAAPKRLPGYLGAQGLPDGAKFLPPPAPAGSLTTQRDTAVFQDTRRLQGTPRWALAQRDAVVSPDAFTGAFGCALGVTLNGRTAPALARLVARVGPDAGAIVDRPKDFWKVPRPFIGNAMPICVERPAALTKSPSYPSGHTTVGWAMGLILAEIAPDRATEVLARARSFGESRVVCGVHTVSDIDQGRALGSALVAAEHGSAEFRADLEAARAELARLRAAGGPPPDAAECAIETDAAAHTPWSR